MWENEINEARKVAGLNPVETGKSISPWQSAIDTARAEAGIGRSALQPKESVSEDTKYRMASPGEIYRGMVKPGIEAVARTPLAVIGGVASAIRGGSPEAIADKSSFLTRIIDTANEQQKELQEKYKNENVVLPLTKILPEGWGANIDTQTIARLPQQAGFSAVAGATGLAAGLGAAAVTTVGTGGAGAAAAPFTGRAAGMAASGAAAYRMQKDASAQQLYESLNEKSTKTLGRAMTPEEWKSAYAKNEGSLIEQGIAEALPEAIGNLGLFEVFFGGAVKTLGKKVAKAAIGKTLEKYGAVAAGKMLAAQAVEQATETWTQQWQHNIDVEMGLEPGKTKRSWTSLSDLAESNREVFADIFLLTAVTGGAGIAGGKVKDRIDEGKSAKLVKDAVAENKFTEIPNEFLPGLYKHAQELSDKRPGDKELAQARDAFTAEMDKRGIDYDMSFKLNEYLALNEKIKGEETTGDDVARWVELRDEFKEKNIDVEKYREYLVYQDNLKNLMKLYKQEKAGKGTPETKAEMDRLTELVQRQTEIFGDGRIPDIEEGGIIKKPEKPPASDAKKVLLGNEPEAKKETTTARSMLTEGDVDIQSEEELSPEAVQKIEETAAAKTAGTTGKRKKIAPPEPGEEAGATATGKPEEPGPTEGPGGGVVDITEHAKAEDVELFAKWDAKDEGAPKFVRARVEKLFAEKGEAGVNAEYKGEDNVSRYARYRLSRLTGTTEEGKEPGEAAAEKVPAKPKPTEPGGAAGAAAEITAKKEEAYAKTETEAAATGIEVAAGAERGGGAAAEGAGKPAARGAGAAEAGAAATAEEGEAEVKEKALTGDKAAEVGGAPGEGTLAEEGFRAWKANKAYIDNNGNYHVPLPGSKRGPIAKWNKAVKKLYPKHEDFQKASDEWALKASEEATAGGASGKPVTAGTTGKTTRKTMEPAQPVKAAEEPGAAAEPPKHEVRFHKSRKTGDKYIATVTEGPHKGVIGHSTNSKEQAVREMMRAIAEREKAGVPELKKEGEKNAAEEGKKPEGGVGEHPGAGGVGTAAEAGSGNRVEPGAAQPNEKGKAEAGEVAPQLGWEKNIFKARKYARALGVDFANKTLNQVVAGINAKLAEGKPAAAKEEGGLDLVVSGQAKPMPGREGVTYTVHKRKPDMIPHTFKVIVSKTEGGFLSEYGTGTTAREAYDKAVEAFDAKIAEREAPPAAKEKAAPAEGGPNWNYPPPEAWEKNLIKARAYAKALQVPYLPSSGADHALTLAELVTAIHEKLKQAPGNAAEKPAAQPTEATETLIGKNADGEDIYEDERGVRYVVEGGIRVVEPVAMVPTRAGVVAQAVRPRDQRYEVAAAAGEAEAKPAESKPFGAENKMFTEDKAAKAREILRKKLGGIHMGAPLDPEIIQAGIDLAGYYIEGGARTFADYSKKMIGDLGDVVRPYLKSFYMAVRNYPGFDKAGMNSEAEIDEIDEKIITLEDKKALMGMLKRDDKVYYKKGDSTGMSTGYFSRHNDGGYITVRSGGGLTTEVFPDDIIRAENEAGPIDINAKKSIIESTGGNEDEHPRDGSTGERPLEEREPESLPANGRGRDSGVGERGGSRSDAARDESLDAGEDDGAGSLASEPSLIHLPDSGRDRTGLPAGEGRGGEGDSLEAAGGGSAAPVSEPRSLKLSGVNPGNYRITPEDNIGGGTRGQKIDGNLAAIRLLKKLTQEKRYPTKEEQSVLAKYVGWGGLKNVFDKASTKPQDIRAREELEQLLTKEEMLEAFLSVTNAHYTSPEIISSIYDVLRHFGFNGGNVLEPTYGAGNFIGMMPEDMAASSKWYGSELDPITAKIGQLLYPDSQLLESGFQVAEFPFGKYDLAIGNPPFGDTRIADTNKNRAAINRFKIHNYVIAKEAMHLKPGGILANVVTTRFLDTADPEARDFLSKNFRFLGAIRLPNDAFTKNAGTQVTTDIVFLQRLMPDEKPDLNADWLTTGATMENSSGETITLNKYFANNPHMMLGEPSMKGTMYGGAWKEGGKGEFTLNKREGQDTGALIQQLLKTQLADLNGIVKQRSEDKADAAALSLTVNKEDVGIGGFYMEGKKLYRRGDDDKYGNPTYEVLTPATQWTAKTALGQKRYDRIRGMLALREKAYKLIAAERFDHDNIEELREDLNKAYDAYVKEFGYLSEPANFGLMSDDVKIEFGLESEYKKAITPARAKSLGVEPKPAVAVKASILNKRVFYPTKEVIYAKDVTDGYGISLSEKGRLDIDYIAGLTGKTADEVTAELSENGLAYQDPETGEWVQEDEYLSGNVKAKYKIAVEKGAEKNAEALKRVFPADKAAENIYVGIGATWIPEEVYAAFGDFIGVANPNVLISHETGRVFLSGDSHQNGVNVEWVNQDYSIADLFNAAAAHKTLVAYDGTGDNRTQNRERTTVLGTIVEKLKTTFDNWVMADEARTAVLVKKFNETQNTHARRKYDGTHLRTVGASPAVVLRNTQRDAAWRMVQSPVVLLDHAVGAGKTFTIITGVMERVRMGLTRKAMIVVPNHLIGQWASDWLKLYPGARILAATNKDFSTANRRRLFSRISTGNYDAIIVGHSSFGFIPLERESIQNLVMEEIAHLERAHAQAKAEGQKRMVAQLAKRIQKKRERMRELMAKPRDNVVHFEQMGIDHVVVDESHEFKNLEYSSAMQNITGMGNPSGSKKAFDLYSKIRFLNTQKGSSVTFATGTPISNSLVELYSLLRYLNRQGLVDRQMEAFDAWASAYASTENRIEYTASQRLKDRVVMATFKNANELTQLYEEFADTITMDDIKRSYAEQMRESNRLTGRNDSEEFPVPKVEGGGRQLVLNEPDELQTKYADYLVARAKRLEDLGRENDPKVDNHLWLMNDARKMALDIRLVDPKATPGNKTKIIRAAKNIKQIYDKSHADKGTQLVFCDLSTPAKTAEADARAFIRSASKIAGLDKDAEAQATLQGIESYQDQWAYLYHRIELEIEAINESRDGETESHMKRREELENFLAEKATDSHVSCLTTADTGFSVYDELKAKLVKMGIPEGEIAFIHDWEGKGKKQELFGLVNAGVVRVLIGSTPKMGAGMNAQERMVALHHLDSPWRPSDVEQREGRLVRQGNALYEKDPENFRAAIYAYSTSGTFDAVMWQVLDRKQGMLDDFRAGKDTIEDTSDDTASYADFMAETTGSPAFKEKHRLEKEIKSLEATKNQILTRRRSAEQGLRYNERQRDASEADIARAEKLEEALKGVENDNFTYKGQEYVNDIDEVESKERARIAAINEKEATAHKAIADPIIEKAQKKFGLEPGGEATTKDLKAFDRYIDEHLEKAGIGRYPKTVYYDRDKIAKKDPTGATAAAVTIRKEINALPKEEGGDVSFDLGGVKITCKVIPLGNKDKEGKDTGHSDYKFFVNGLYVGAVTKQIALGWDEFHIFLSADSIRAIVARNKHNAEVRIGHLDKDDQRYRQTLEKLQFKDEAKLAEKQERYEDVVDEVADIEDAIAERRAVEQNQYIDNDVKRFGNYTPTVEKRSRKARLSKAEKDALRVQANESWEDYQDHGDDEYPIWAAKAAKAKAILSAYGEGDLEAAQDTLKMAKDAWDEDYDWKPYPQEFQVAQNIITSIRQGQGRLFEGYKYSVRATGRGQMPTLEDVQKIFAGQEVRQLQSGAIAIQTRGGHTLVVKTVESITPDRISLRIGYGKTKLKPGQAITGAYISDKTTHGFTAGTIELNRLHGDTWTLAHESVHFMEDAGILSQFDVITLKGHIKGLVKAGKFEPKNRNDIGGAEDRAEFLAQQLTAKAKPTGAIGNIVARIRNFIDKLANAFGKRTVGGIVRDIESGRIYERHGEGASARGAAGAKYSTGTMQRTQGIPAVAGRIITSYYNSKKMKAHPDYDAAKAGDWAAAERLVVDLVKPETIAAAKERFGADAIYVAPHAIEATGKNAIPNALAHLYAERTGATSDAGIIQGVRAFHTGAGAMDRMISRVMFDGDVVKGGKYVLVDDVTTLGGTFAELAHHIQANGGTVAGVITLTNASRSGIITANQQVIDEIERRFGNEVRELFGIDPKSLTATEARYLNGFRDADTLRNRAVKARQERQQRLLSKGIRQSEEKPITSYQIEAFEGGAADILNSPEGRFSTKYIGTGTNSTAFGWGLYFTSRAEVAKMYADLAAKRKGTHKQKDSHHLYGVTLHKGKTPDQYDYLRWDERLTERQAMKIRNRLQASGQTTALNKKAMQAALFDGTGAQTYETLTDMLGSKEAASRWLLKAGIDGTTWRADYVMDNVPEGTRNYVVFDDKAVQIEQHRQYRVVDLFRQTRPNDPVRSGSLFKDVDARLKEARGIKTAKLKDRARDTLLEGFQHFTRHFQHLDPKKDGAVIDVLRQFQEVPAWAKEETANRLVDFVGKLTPNGREVFAMNIILPDMLRDIDSGLLDPASEEGLPFGYKDRAQVEEDLDNFKAKMTPEIERALEKRNAFMKDLTGQLIEHKLLNKELANNPEAYFHHQVLDYMNYKANPSWGVSSGDVRTHRKGWQLSRKGSRLDYNTEYVESEFEVVSQALAQIETVKTLKEVEKLTDIKKQLTDEARRENMAAFRRWAEENVPPDEDPLKPFKTKMAIGFAKLTKAIEDGDINVPPEFEDVAEHFVEQAEGLKGARKDERDIAEVIVPHPKTFAFLSWLVNHSQAGAMPAAMVFKAIAQRNQFIRQAVGDKWVTYRNLVPEGYVVHKPEASSTFYFANSLTDRVVDQVVSGQRALADTDLRKVLARGKDAEWVVPEGVSKTLNEFRPALADSLPGRMSKDLLSTWKQWVLMNPFRVLKYNVNNMSGDMDICMAYDPKIITQYMVPAFKELWAQYQGTASGKLKEEMSALARKGLIGSGMTAMDIPELNKVGSTKALVDFMDGRSKGALMWWWSQSKKLSTLRENVLRLAAYRYFTDQLKTRTDVYGASRKAEIDAIADRDDRAVKLARELIGDYGNISHAGQYLRERIIPFYSWIEINAPRYVRLFRNLKHEGGSMTGMAGTMAWKATKLGLKACALMALVALWNGAMFPDEEEELQETGREQLHLILGRRADGSIITLRFQGALSDAMSWFGMDNPFETAKRISKGRMSGKDVAKEVITAAPKKLFQGLRPEPKLLYEVVSGQSYFPDPTRPRPIRDTAEHIARVFSLDRVYNRLAGKPIKGGDWSEQLKADIQGLLLAESDPGEQAYYTARKYVFEWLDKSGKEKPVSMPTNRSNALYYYKQALRFGDFEAAARYLGKYKELGGKESNVSQSIKRAAPLASLKLADRYQFKQSLTAEQQQTLKVALDWYKVHYVGGRREEVERRAAG